MSGSNMPIDVDPIICEFEVPGPYYELDQAKVVIVFRRGQNHIGVPVAANSAFFAAVCHFDTCPNADEHRKGSGGGD
jgi:hypothetical protein